MSRVRPFPFLLLALPCLAGSACLDFEQAEKSFCAGATPEQRASACDTRGQGPAMALAFTSTPQAVSAGQCSQALTLQARGSTGAATTVAQELPISLAATPATGFGFYVDPGCTSPISGTTIPAGHHTSEVYFRSTAAGAVSLTASSASLSTALLSVKVEAALPSELAFATTPQVVVVGSCSGRVTLESRDEFGNRSPVSAPRVVALKAEPASALSFHADPDCTSTLSTLPLDTGSSGGGFYFKGSATGTVKLSASTPGLGQASQLAHLFVGTARALAFTSAPQQREAGKCEGPVTFQAVDAQGYRVPLAHPTWVTLSAPSGAGVTFYDGADCQGAITHLSLSPDSGNGRLYFIATQAGTARLTVSAEELESANTEEPVREGPPQGLVFATPEQTVPAGACSGAVSIQVRDVYGNPSPVAEDLPVSLVPSSGSDVTLYWQGNCTGALTGGVQIPKGGSHLTLYFRGDRAGSFTLTASSSLPGAVQPLRLLPGSPSRLGFTTTPRMAVAGSCSSEVRLQAQDVFGNASAVAGEASVALQVSPTASVTLYADPACSQPISSLTLGANGAGDSLYFRGTRAQSFALTASTTGLSSASQEQRLVAAHPKALLLTTAPHTHTTGSCSGRVGLLLKDAFDNMATPSSPLLVALGVPLGSGLTLYADSACTQPVTQLSLTASSGGFYVAGTTPGTFTLTASASGLTGASLEHTLTAGPASTLGFTTPPQTIQASTCSEVLTVQVQDVYGNASWVSASTPVSLSASPALGVSFYSDAGCTSPIASVTLAAGVPERSFYLKATSAGDLTLAASASGMTSALQALTVLAGAPGRLAFTSAAQTVAAGTCSAQVTVRTEDASGNAAPNATSLGVGLSASPVEGFTFYADAGCTTPITQLTLAAGAGSGSFYFRGTKAQAVTVSAFASGFSRATQGEAVAAGPPAALHFTTTGQTLLVGSCSGVATVQARDAHGNPTTLTTATPVTLNAAPPSGFGFYSDSGCGSPVTQVSIPAGASSASFYFGGLTAGTLTLTASATGLANDQQEATLQPLSPVALAFSSAPPSLTAGACAALTLQTRDRHDNPSGVGGSTTVGLAASPSTGFAFYSDAACSTLVTEVSLSTGASQAALYMRGTSASTVKVTASSTGLTSASQDFPLSPGPTAQVLFRSSSQTLLAGACSAVATVESLDAYGNPTTAVVDIDLAGTGFLFYSDAGCDSPITRVSTTAGSSRASFYFKGLTGGTHALAASASGAPPGTLQHTILPTVRTGTCTLGSGNSTVSCSLSPALLSMSKAFLIFQATNTSNDDKNGKANVRCTLTSTSSIRCERQESEGGQIPIRWYVAEFPSGVSVQHLQPTCSGSVRLPTAVTPEQTFLLISQEGGGDGGLDGDRGFRTATLTNSTTVSIQTSGDCNSGEANSLQVVAFTGATVHRGSITLSGSSATVSGLPAVDLTRSFLLFSYVNNSSNYLCNRSLRGELTSTTGLTFTRGLGNSSCLSDSVTISWERVQLPPGSLVQQSTHTLAAGARTLTHSLGTAVDLTRSLALSGGQWSSGQVHGEGNYASSSPDYIGAMRARLSLIAPTTLEVTRERTTGSARFTPFVIQFHP